MYQELQSKVTEEKPSYRREEIQWLLEHLGDPSPEIRDDLVFTSLARGIQEELFTQEQFHFISKTIISDEGVEKEIDKIGLSTLDRSFRALIYANLLSADANKQSIFYQGLKADIRYIILDQGLHYLLKEKDTTGFSSQYGWVHAFAHGADLLTEVVCHPEFPNKKFTKDWTYLAKFLKEIQFVLQMMRIGV